jgi:hypothetical protein
MSVVEIAKNSVQVPRGLIGNPVETRNGPAAVILIPFWKTLSAMYATDLIVIGKAAGRGGESEDLPE